MVPENRRWSAAGSRLAPAGMTTGYGAACRAAWRLGCSDPGVASPGLDRDQVPTIEAAVAGLSHGRRTAPRSSTGKSPGNGGMTRRRRGADDLVVVHAPATWCKGRCTNSGPNPDNRTESRFLTCALALPDLGTAESALTDAAVSLVIQNTRSPIGVGTNRRHKDSSVSVLIVTLECKPALLYTLRFHRL